VKPGIHGVAGPRVPREAGTPGYPDRIFQLVQQIALPDCRGLPPATRAKVIGCS
jgi:hypothetical protein